MRAQLIQSLSTKPKLSLSHSTMDLLEDESSVANTSFCSLSSVGEESTVTERLFDNPDDVSKKADKVVVHGSKVRRASYFISLRADSDDENEEKLTFGEYLLRSPVGYNLQNDRQSILSFRQNLLNDFVLRQTNATVCRQDHHIMLIQLLGEAYFRDPDRCANRPMWRAIVAAVGKEYWGANAIFNLSPDPYHHVLSKLSSMSIWNHTQRKFGYKYWGDEITHRQARQMEVLEKLKQSGKLFL